MGLETATHINDLNSSNPLGSDTKAQGDDHIRLLKDVVKRDLPMTQAAGAKGLELLYTATAAAARAALGLSYTGYRNRVINGGFTFNQRFNDVAQTITAGAALKYIADRFFVYCTTTDASANTGIGLLGNGVFSVSGTGSPCTITVGTRLPQIATRTLSGLSTLSVRILATTSATVNWFVYSANTANTFGTIASPTKTLDASGSFSVGTTEATYSANFTCDGQNGVEVLFTTSAGVTEIKYSNIQLEKGTVANTDIVFDEVNPVTELARCNYFYQKFSGVDGLAVLGSGHQNSTTASRLTLPIQPMRAKPTAAFGGGVFLDTAGAATAATLSSQFNASNSVAFDVTHAAVGAAAGAAMLQLSSGAANYIEIDAEMYT